MKLFPTPPDSDDSEAFPPYSIRSFIHQASSRFSGCTYHTTQYAEVMGEPVYRDYCYSDGDNSEAQDCHFIAGWIKGKMSCQLWNNLSVLFQTEAERKFLHHYISLVKDRQFPMLIPQARIGIAERRRPDFVLFVPINYWKYKWCAIELDQAHVPENEEADETRNIDLRLHGYEVISLKPDKRGLMSEVKNLVERIELDITQADSDPWNSAVEVPVRKIETPTITEDDIPF